MFRRKGLLPHTLECLAAVGDLDAVRQELVEGGTDPAAVNDAFVRACALGGRIAVPVLWRGLLPVRSRSPLPGQPLARAGWEEAVARIRSRSAREGYNWPMGGSQDETQDDVTAPVPFGPGPPAARRRPPCVEVMSDDMAAVFGRMTGAERLEVASRMFTSARRMLISHLRASHPDWDEPRIEQEAARRLSHGAV